MGSGERAQKQPARLVPAFPYLGAHPGACAPRRRSGIEIQIWDGPIPLPPSTCPHRGASRPSDRRRVFGSMPSPGVFHIRAHAVHPG